MYHCLFTQLLQHSGRLQNNLIARNRYYNSRVFTIRWVKKKKCSDVYVASNMYIQRHIELSKETNSNIFFWMLEQEQKTDPENLVRRTIYTKEKEKD
jgi:hypothetical protein